MKSQMTGLDQVSVQLMGEKYTLCGNITSDYALSVASYLEDKLLKTKAVSSQIDDIQLVLLTAMNIIDELFQTHQEMDELPRSMHDLKRIGQKTDDLISALEDRIIGREQGALE